MSVGGQVSEQVSERERRERGEREERERERKRERDEYVWVGKYCTDQCIS